MPGNNPIKGAMNLLHLREPSHRRAVAQATEESEQTADVSSVDAHAVLTINEEEKTNVEISSTNVSNVHTVLEPVRRFIDPFRHNERDARRADIATNFSNIREQFGVINEQNSTQARQLAGILERLDTIEATQNNSMTNLETRVFDMLESMMSARFLALDRSIADTRRDFCSHEQSSTQRTLDVEAGISRHLESLDHDVASMRETNLSYAQETGQQLARLETQMDNHFQMLDQQLGVMNTREQGVSRAIANIETRTSDRLQAIEHCVAGIGAVVSVRAERDAHVDPIVREVVQVENRSATINTVTRKYDKNHILTFQRNLQGGQIEVSIKKHGKTLSSTEAQTMAKKYLQRDDGLSFSEGESAMLREFLNPASISNSSIHRLFSHSRQNDRENTPSLQNQM